MNDWQIYVTSVTICPKQTLEFNSLFQIDSYFNSLKFWIEMSNPSGRLVV